MTPFGDFLCLLPEIAVAATGCVLLLLIPTRLPRSFLKGLTAAGLIGSAVATVFLWGKSRLLFDGTYALDAYALLFKGIFLLSVAFTLLISASFAKQNPLPEGEYGVLLLFSVLGMMVMAAGLDLLVIYLGLEVMAIASYCLVGFLKKDSLSMEGALKYFLLGAVNSGVLLYGIALLYGATGTTNLTLLPQRLASAAPGALLPIAVVLLTVGFAFKLAAVPFHMWAPDVYEGAPTPIAGFVSVASKAAALSALARLFLASLPSLKADWQPLLILLSALSMTVGNLLALPQTNLKRLLGYSSIAHAGYLLIGAACATPQGLFALLYYLIAYLAMNLGAFGMLVHLSRKGKPLLSIEDLRDLSERSPFWSFCFLVFMLSLAGIPPTAGFLGKFYLFASALQAGLVPLAVIAVLNSVLALYYYFRIVRSLYLETPKTRREETGFPWQTTVALSFLGLLTLGLGLYPTPLLELIRQAASAF